MDRTTPTIRLRVKLPGGPSAVRAPALDDLPGNASRILRLTYEDTEKGTDKAKLEINNYDLRFPDDPTFDRGNGLFLQWGYPGNFRPESELVIVDWTPGPKFMVKAHSKGTLLNRYPVDATYYGMRYSDVAAIIAEQHGFGAEVRFIEPTPFVVESIPQPNITDGQMLRQMANRVGYVFFVDASGFHFHTRALGQRPLKTLEYFGPGRGELKEYPAFEEAPAGQPGAVTLKGTDPLTKKPIEVRADNTTTAGRPGLAKEIEVIDKRTAQTSLRPNAGRETVALTTATTAAEAKVQAHGLYRKAIGLPVKCTASCFGDPQFQAKTTVALLGIGRRLSGNYYCSQVTHVVEPGNYTMTLKLARDGTNGAGGVAAPSAKSAAAVNEQKAPAGGAGGIEPREVIDGRTGQTKTIFLPVGPKGSR